MFSGSNHPLGGVRNGCPLGPISDPMLESTHESKALVARPGVFSDSTHPLGGVHNGCLRGPISDPMLESSRGIKHPGSPRGSRPGVTARARQKSPKSMVPRLYKVWQHACRATVVAKTHQHP